MRLKEILHITLALLLLTGCTTTEKFSVHVPAGTKIYTPDNSVTPNGIATNYEKVDVTVPSDMYCGYILVQSAESDIKIPIGVDYKTDSHIGAKAALYTGYTLGCIGCGGAVLGASCMVAAYAGGDSGSTALFGIITGASAGVGLVGAAIGMPADFRMRQTAYDYNFGYEKKQIVKMPMLSPTLLHPNNPKGYEKENASKKESSTRRKKASSGNDVKPDIISSSKVNKARSDHSKKVEGEYKGNGILLFGKNVDEKYSEIAVVIKRIDKRHVSVRIIESNDDYFEAPLVYEINANKNGGYNLNIENLPEASIMITRSGKLTFKHQKVNIDNLIYTLEITAQKSNE